jgi:hypothetical protein
MENTEQTQLSQPSLNIEILVDADSCARELKRCAGEADKCAAMAQGCAEIAIRHAWNAGTICNRAKEIVPHGTFKDWLEQNCGDRGYHTMLKWMKLAKVDLNLLLEVQNVKNLKEAYIAAGVLPEPEAKTEGGEGEAKDKPPFTLTFKTNWRSVSEWSRDAAKDFLYEFDRLAQLARSLKTEFGL